MQHKTGHPILGFRRLTSYLLPLTSYLLLFLPSLLSAQSPTDISWEEMMLDPAYNFFQIQAAFNAEWDGKPYQSGNGYKQFKRWEYLRETTVDSNGIYDNLYIREEFQKFLAHDFNRGAGNKSNVACSTPNSGGDWAALGPFNEPAGNNGIGRVNIVAFHPTDANIIWVGSPAGGLWKSTNGGTAWTTSTDAFQNLGVSDIAINPANPDIMYLGTGDRDHSDTYTFGLLKSTDGGMTWATTSLPVSSFNLIHRVLINPSNPDILLVATSSGLWRSLNAGTDWTQINSTYFRHLEFKPGDPEIVYASSYSSSQFYRSTNGGASFSPVTLPAPSSGNTVQRFAITVSAADPAVVYLLGSYNDPAGSNDFNGIYKSVDSGATFSQVTATTPPALGSQSWYDWTLAASPANANELYAGGVGFYKSTNGGVTWASANSGGGVSVHVDHHWAGYQPVTNVLFVGSDGGVFKTANSATTWTDLSNGLSITQYYRLGASSLSPSLILTGSQDNGTHLLSGTNWEHVFGGDGMECLISHNNDNVMFASYQNGFVMKSTDGGNSFPINSITPTITSESGAWVTPYVMNPSDANVMYAGYKSIWKSVNQGLNWTNSSGLLTTGNFQNIAVAPSDGNVVYATDYNQIWKTTNGGTSWTATTDPGSSIRYIAVHASDPNTLWICRNNDVLKSINGGTSWMDVSGNLPNIPMRTVAFQPNANNAIYVGSEVGVWFKNDLLANWELFSDNLPNVIIDELQIFPLTGKIRAATFGRGLWESDLYCNDNLTCTNIVGIYPYAEGFETNFGLWEQETTDNFDWTRQTGPTPTPNTGPEAAVEGSFYIYAEATERTPGDIALLRSPCLNLGSVNNPALYFSYHMQGAQIGTLSLEVSNNLGTTWTTAWTLTGNQGSDWLNTSVNLATYAVGGAVVLRFRAVIAGDEGDIAVDDLYIGEGCGTPVAAYPYSESFEAGTGLWTQSSADDIDWTQLSGPTATGSTGPDLAYDGTYYMYVESSSPNFPNKVAILTGPCFNLAGLATPTFSFGRHLYGATMGTLALEVSTNGGRNWLPTPLWTLSGNQGNAWALVEVSLAAYAGQTIKLRFKGTTGSSFTSDMAIDKVSVANAGTLPPNCSSLSTPVPGAVGVAATTVLTWAAASGAPTGYRLDVGTSSGGTQILNNFDVGNVTTYDPPGNFPGLTTIYVKVKPYNANGTALGCNEQSFTTGGNLSNPSACPLSLSFPDISCTTANRFNVQVASAPGNALGSNVFLTNVKIIVQHTWDEDLDIFLYSPSGTAVELSTDNGSSGDNYGNPSDATCSQVTNFSMSAATSITAGTPPYIGTYLPEGNFASFNTGINPVGVWVIELCDDEAQDAGILKYIELVFASPPACTNLTAPANGASNVPLTSALSWAAASGSPPVAGYRLDVGTSSGGTQILNNFDVGNVTTYDPPGNFPASANIYVKIKPYNAVGSSPGCTEQSFSTAVPPPACTVLSNPANGATNVPVTTGLTWTAPASGAAPTGYRLNAGTTPGGTDILNNVDVGNVLTYDPPGDFGYNITIYVTVIPYNGTGSATGCVETSFSTQTALPGCTVLSSPANGATNVAATTSLTWTVAPNVPTGYRLNAGTTPGGTDILNNVDVGNVLTYDPPGNLPYSSTIYVTVIPYNGTGSATGCTETSFTTQISPPGCTNITDPAHGATAVPVSASLSWLAANGSPTGYRLNAGTTPGGTDILNSVDVGNVLTYDPPGNLPYGTIIYVTVIPYNGTGANASCVEQSFTTQIAPPACTTLSSPANGASDVPANTTLTWVAASGTPIGYRLDAGTTPGGTDILNNFDAGNVLTYDPPGYFAYGATIYVTIKPYNAAGSASSCAEQNFTTGNCIPNLNIVSIPVPAGTHKSLGDLLSHTSMVANGTVVIFTSDTGVLLNGEFVVETGGVFEVNIVGCSMSGVNGGVGENRD